MLPYRDSRLTQIALAIFFIIIIGYAYYEGRGLLYGPKITVPSTVQEVHDQFVLIRGRADSIAQLRMNGKPISVTETGDFQEPYLLSPGLNRIILDATDKYGRSRQEVIQIVYIATSTPTNASAVATTSTSTTATSSSTQ